MDKIRGIRDKMQSTTSSKPATTMLTSQETIAQLQSEILKLKLIKHQYEQKAASNMDETKRDLVADLLTQNEEMRRQLDEIEERRNELKDVACQTNLDLMNIEQLIEASVTLKRQKRQQTEPKFPQHHSQPANEPDEHYYTQPYSSQPTLQSQRHHYPKPVVSQLNYPHVTLPKQVTLTKNMTMEEKESLEKLFALDGLLTTTRDRLQAAVDVQQN